MDSSSGRNKFNAGSDSAVHHKGTAHEQYQRTPDTPKSEPITGKHDHGFVGNGKPGPADERSKVK
jgi:hypothetical protein